MPTSARKRKTRRNRNATRSRRPRLEALEQRMLLATIQGTVFEDLNGDGVQDAG